MFGAKKIYLYHFYPDREMRGNILYPFFDLKNKISNADYEELKNKHLANGNDVNLVIKGLPEEIKRGEVLFFLTINPQRIFDSRAVFLKGNSAEKKLVLKSKMKVWKIPLEVFDSNKLFIKVPRSENINQYYLFNEKFDVKRHSVVNNEMRAYHQDEAKKNVKHSLLKGAPEVLYKGYLDILDKRIKTIVVTSYGYEEE